MLNVLNVLKPPQNPTNNKGCNHVDSEFLGTTKTINKARIKQARMFDKKVPNGKLPE